MAMPLWRHIYPMTTTVNIPGQGPTALRPQQEFRAPRAVVKHLLKIKRVVGPLPEPKTPPKKPAEEPKAEAQAPTPPTPQPPKTEEATPLVKEAEPHGDAKGEVDVVASESSSATTEPTEDSGTETSRVAADEDKEKESQPKRRKKTRSRS